MVTCKSAVEYMPILRSSLYFNLYNTNQNSNPKSNFDLDSLHHIPLKLIDIKCENRQAHLNCHWQPGASVSLNLGNISSLAKIFFFLNTVYQQ
jgi:hypothetical protein